MLGFAFLGLICCGVIAQGTTGNAAADGAGQTPLQQVEQRPAKPDQVAADQATSDQAATVEPDQPTGNPAGNAQHKIEPILLPPDRFEPAAATGRKQPGFHWRGALLQSLLMLGTQRGVDLLTEPDTRLNLRGPFFKDYARSVANLHGWRDGDPTATNYLAHPFQGAISGFIQVQNDPKGITKKFSLSRAYWKSRMKAMGWSAAYSAYFELGPGISEAMIGNVGLPAQYRPPGSHPRPANGGMGFVDMVITPTVGTAWLVSEDIIDRYVISKLEKRTRSTFLQVSLRVLLNPARSSANLLRVEKPWHRDSRGSAVLVSNVGEP